MNAANLAAEPNRADDFTFSDTAETAID